MYKGNVKEINLHNLGAILKPIFLSLIPTHSNDNHLSSAINTKYNSSVFSAKNPHS